MGDTQAPPAPYVADCYLCPGNSRVSGQRNPDYTGVFAFDNDHPCVGPLAPQPPSPARPPYQSRRADGRSRVVCYSPRHDLSLAELPRDEVVRLLEALQEEFRMLASLAGVRHVLMFENRGEVVGVSNPHPHCQIYATNFVFRTIELEAEASETYLTEHGRVLFHDIIAAEEEHAGRLLNAGPHALAFVPYFARYPYETFIAPRATHANIAELSATEIEHLADSLRDVLVRMDNLWRRPFPYVLVFHQAPLDGAPHPGFHFHIEIHPPLRRPGLLKYLAGPEIGGGNFLNDTDPDAKANELRSQSSTHYRQEAPT